MPLKTRLCEIFLNEYFRGNSFIVRKQTNNNTNAVFILLIFFFFHNILYYSTDTSIIIALEFYRKVTRFTQTVYTI